MTKFNVGDKLQRIKPEAAENLITILDDSMMLDYVVRYSDTQRAANLSKAYVGVTFELIESAPAVPETTNELNAEEMEVIQYALAFTAIEDIDSDMADKCFNLYRRLVDGQE